MTKDDVFWRLAKITELADDDEAAHVQEDKLHVDVLKAIGWTHGEPTVEQMRQGVELAREALKSLEIRFGRYCA